MNIILPKEKCMCLNLLRYVDIPESLFRNGWKSNHSIDVQSSSHILRVHIVTSNSQCHYRMTSQFESVEIPPMLTLQVDNKLIIDGGHECKHLMYGIWSRLCIIRLLTQHQYQNVTVDLQFTGQSDPRCHVFAVSVFDEGASLKLFEYSKEFPLADTITKFEGKEIPLTNHADPILLRDESCQTGLKSYVSTTNSILLVVYLEHSYIHWDNLTLKVISKTTSCQAFTQFPLEPGFLMRMIENNSYHVDKMMDVGHFDSRYYYSAGMLLRVAAYTSNHDTYGMGIYLKSVKLTYFKLATSSDIFLVVQKNTNQCIVYQYIHNIYYNTWLNTPERVIILTVVKDHASVNKMSGNVMTVQFHIVYALLNNRTSNSSVKKKSGTWEYILAHNQFVNYTRFLEEFTIEKKTLLFQITMFPGVESCNNITEWYNGVNNNSLMWPAMSSLQYRSIYQCYSYSGAMSYLDCAQSPIVEYFHEMLTHTIDCMHFLIDDSFTTLYWLPIPYNNRAIWIIYANFCLPLSTVDEISVTRASTTTVTVLSWMGPPDIEIGYFGNPLIQSPTTVNISRKFLISEAHSMCPIEVTISKYTSTSIYNMQSSLFWNEEDYVLMPQMTNLSWNDANRRCHEQGMEILEPYADTEEKFIVNLILKNNHNINIPLPIFYGPTMRKVNLDRHFGHPILCMAICNTYESFTHNINIVRVS